MFHDIAACAEIVYSARATFTRIHIKFGDTEAPPRRSKTRHAATLPRRHVATAYGSLARLQKYQCCEGFNTLMALMSQI